MINLQAEIFNLDDQFIVLKTQEGNDLELGKVYNITFKKYRSCRSIEQNKLMWEIISRIAKETNNDEMDVYAYGLEKANAKFEFLMILPEALESVKQTFRAVKICESREYNGKNMLVIKAFIGSSKFDVSEMTELINYFIQLASELNIYIGDIIK